MRRLIFGMVFVSAFYGWVFSAQAEVAKILHVCDRQERMCPEFRPQVKTPAGWLRDDVASLKYGASMFVLKGKTFGKAETIIYAEGRYNKDRTDLEQWVASSDREWAATSGENASITRLPSDNPRVIINRYDNPSLKDQPFEVVAHYADLDRDGNAYVVRLGVSGFKEAAVLAAVPILAKIIASANVR